MSEWLRSAWNRPISERERKGAFALAALTLIVGAAVLMLLTRDTAAPSPREQDSPAASEPSTPSDAVPVDEGPGTAQQTAASLEDVRPTVQAFLKAYLPYTYGAPVRPLRATTSDELYDQLAAEPPRAPRGARGSSARVLALTSGEDASRDAISVLALVQDKRSRYSVTIRVEQTTDGWRVTGVDAA